MVDTTEHYDDNAAVYFFLTLLGIILFPWSISMIFKLQALFDKSHIGACRCDQCKAKESAIEKRRKEYSGFAVFKLGLFVLLWVLFLTVLMNGRTLDAPSGNETDSLKLEGATAEEIKKSHRKLSIKYHPDKNKDPGAEEMFIKVNKAHQILTDPEKLAIWERYGSPDGPRAVEIGIALPSWLVSGKYTSVIILVYSFFLVVLIPGGVFLWTRQQKKYSATKVSMNTIALYHHLVVEKLTFSKLLPVLSTAEEYQVRYHPEQEPALAELRKVVPRETTISGKNQRSGVKEKDKKNPLKLISKKMRAYFFAHFSRLTSKVPAGLLADYRYSMDIAPKLLGGLMETCLYYRMTRPALDVIRISQMVTQAAWNGPMTNIKDTSVLQLPHVTAANLDAWNRKFTKERTIRDYLALNEAAREQLLTETFQLTPSQIADVRAVEKLLPYDVSLEVQSDVGDKHGIVTDNSIVTIRFLLSRPSFPALQRKNPDAFIPAHAPYLSGSINETKEECWWVLMSNFNASENTHNLVYLQKIKCLRDGSNFETKMPPLRPGNYNFDVHLMCDSYIGFDTKRVLTIDVKPAAELQKLREEAHQQHEADGSSSEEEQDWSDEYAQLSSRAALEDTDSEDL